MPFLETRFFEALFFLKRCENLLLIYLYNYLFGTKNLHISDSIRYSPIAKKQQQIDSCVLMNPPGKV